MSDFFLFSESSVFVMVDWLLQKLLCCYSVGIKYSFGIKYSLTKPFIYNVIKGSTSVLSI